MGQRDDDAGRMLSELEMMGAQLHRMAVAIEVLTLAVNIGKGLDHLGHLPRDEAIDAAAIGARKIRSRAHLEYLRDHMRPEHGTEHEEEHRASKA